MFLLDLNVSAEEPMQGANLIKKGDYISTDGCMETHGYGMAEDAWKVIKSAGKYYIIDFDIRCGKDVKPYFISDGFLFSRQLHIELKPMGIQKKYQFTVGHDNQILMQKGDNIIISLSEKQKDKAKKYLLKIESKERLSEREKINKERAKRMLSPDGYIVFAKPAYAKYQRVFDWAPTFAMIKAISEHDVESVKILLKSKERVNECVENGVVSYVATAYEVLKEKKKEIADEIQGKKRSFTKVPNELKEAKKKIDEIYQLFNRYGQTSTCKNKKLKIENSAQKIKWIVPSGSICENEGGKFDDGVCITDWLKARRICRLSDGRLPNIDELKAEITSCGGKVGDWEDNIRNQSFLSCIKEKNFHDFKNYWSLSLEKKEKDRVYMMNAAMSAGDIRKSYPIDDFPEAVMCVQEPNNEQIQEDTHTDKWITPENSICKKEGGKLDIGTCKANWQQAQNICRASGGVLPSIDELKAVVASCDGKIANSEAEQINNIKNTNYQQCYRQKGFSDLDYYWSATDVGTPGARWRANMWSGTIRWNIESAHYYVRCVRDGKKYTKPSWCTASRLNKTERTICTDATLSALDIKLAEIYGASKARHKDIAQRNWLKKRNRCGSNVSCIKSTYEERIHILQAASKKDLRTTKAMQEKATKQKPSPSKSDTSMDKMVLENLKKSMHYILDRDMKAFANITDSGRVFTRTVIEKVIYSETSWKKNFLFLDGVTHSDVDTLQIYKKASRDKERTCRYLATGEEVPCKSLEYCFTIDDKTLPDKGCLDIYYIQGRIYWEPFGW